MNDVELIDLYLDGELSAEQAADFERRLADDAVFAEEFAWHKSLREVVGEQSHIQEMTNSIMRRLEAVGYFEEAPIVSTVKSAPLPRKINWPQIALLLLLIVVPGWFFREKIKNLFTTETIGAFPPPPPPSNHANPSPPVQPEPQAKATPANVESNAIQYFKKTLEYSDSRMGEGDQVPASNDTIGMGAYFLKNGNIAAAEKLFRPLLTSSNDSLALWGIDGMGSVAFFRKQYRQAFQYFEKVAADTIYVDDDYKSILELQMFLCCVADWQYLEARGYEIFNKILEHKDYIDDACKLQAELQRKGLWRSKSKCQFKK